MTVLLFHTAQNRMSQWSTLGCIGMYIWYHCKGQILSFTLVYNICKSIAPRRNADQISITFRTPLVQNKSTTIPLSSTILEFAITIKAFKTTNVKFGTFASPRFVQKYIMFTYNV